MEVMGKVRGSMYGVTGAEKAYLDKRGSVFVCITLSSDHLKMWYVMDKFPETNKYTHYFAANMDKSNCTKTPTEAMQNIEVLPVTLSSGKKYTSNEKVIENLLKRYVDTTLYVLKEQDAKYPRFFYSSDGDIIPISYGNAVIPPNEGSPFWYPLMIPAVAIDIVLSPVYLIYGLVVIYQVGASFDH
jgi:hypothetical protein